MRVAFALAFLLVAVSAVAAKDCADVDSVYARAGAALGIAHKAGLDLNKPLDAYMVASDNFFRCHQQQWLLAKSPPKEPQVAQTAPRP